MKFNFLTLTLLSFTAFSQQKAVKDSFNIYKDNHQYIKAFNYSEKLSKSYLNQKKYNLYINQVLKTSSLLSTEIKDDKRAYKLTLGALNNTHKKASNYDRVKLFEDLVKINIRFKKLPQALEISKRSLKLAASAKNDTVFAKLNEDILSIYLQSEERDSAFKYLEPTLKAAKKIKHDVLLANIFNLHFYFYTNIKEPEIAKKYLDSSLIYAIKSNDISAIETAKNNLGVHYVSTEKDYNKAIKLYTELIEDSKKHSLQEKNASIAYLNLSYIYNELGNHKKAYEYQSIYVDFIDSLLLHKNDSELEKIKTQYELDKAENEYKEKEHLLQQKQLKNEKMLYLLLAILMFLAVLFYFFYQNLKLRQKNKLKDIHHTTQQNIVNATIDGQEEERKRLSGVLHDNISALLSSAGLHISAFEANYPEMKDELTKTKNILKEAHDKVRDLSHDLIPPVLDKFGLAMAFQDLCEKNSNSLIHFNFNNLTANEERFQNEFETKLYFIVAELFNNIIKHSKASEATLTLEKQSNQLAINIKDNGKGFNLNESDSQKGLGLSQIKTRIKSMNGSISINSKEQLGTIIHIKVEIPDSKSNAGSQFHNA